MRSTSTASKTLLRAQQVLIGKLMLVAWTEALSSEDGCASLETHQMLCRIGGTQKQQDQARDAIYHATHNQTGIYKPGRGFVTRPIGPLMGKAIAAAQEYERSLPAPEPLPDNVIRVGDTTIVINEAPGLSREGAILAALQPAAPRRRPAPIHALRGKRARRKYTAWLN